MDKKQFDQKAGLTHQAEQDLRRDIQRNAARAREAGSYDDVEHVQQDAAETEVQTGAERHHDAF